MPAANEKPESEHSDPSDDCSDTGTENSKNDDAEINEIMDVDFEFCVPVEIHFHGIKTLLKQVFSTDFEMINLSELSDLIIKQSSVGSVVKVDDSEDPYALMTVISSLLSKDHECIKQLTEFIIKKANESIREKVKGIMKSNVGFIFNERLINMPYQLAPPLFKSIKEEIDKMNEDNVEQFNFDYYVFISKVYQEVQATVSNPKKKKRKSDSAAKNSTKDEYFYFQAEDEAIMEFCDFSFTYKPPRQQSSDSRRVFSDIGIEPSRLVIFVEAKKFEAMCKRIEQYLIE